MGPLNFALSLSFSFSFPLSLFLSLSLSPFLSMFFSHFFTSFPMPPFCSTIPRPSLHVRLCLPHCRPQQFEVSERASKRVSTMERRGARVQRSARTKRAVRSKQMSERCGRTTKQISEWPSTCVPIFGCSQSPCHPPVFYHIFCSAA